MQQEVPETLVTAAQLRPPRAPETKQRTAYTQIAAIQCTFHGCLKRSNHFLFLPDDATTKGYVHALVNPQMPDCMLGFRNHSHRALDSIVDALQHALRPRLRCVGWVHLVSC